MGSHISDCNHSIQHHAVPPDALCVSHPRSAEHRLFASMSLGYHQTSSYRSCACDLEFDRKMRCLEMETRALFAVTLQRHGTKGMHPYWILFRWWDELCRGNR